MTIRRNKLLFIELNSIYWPIGARLKYTLFFFIFQWHSQKMSRRVSYTHQYLSRTESYTKKKHTISRVLFFVLALPIFPASHPASIVGEGVLNFCVRDGNRWTHTPINTNYYQGYTLKTEHGLLPLCILRLGCL